MKRVILLVLLCFPVCAYAGDEEVPALAERANAEPYTKTGAQLQVFRAQLAKIIDIHDDIKESLQLQQYFFIIGCFGWGTTLYIAYMQRW